MRYWMLRVFLVRRKEPPLLEAMRPTTTPTETRLQYLSRVFGSEIRFRHHGSEFVYRHFQTIDTRIIAGVIARQRTATIGLPPEQQFQPQQVADWETANVFMDVTEHADGQKVAMQSNPDVGNPLALFRSLADHLNEARPEPEWIMAVNPITAQDDFWETVKQSRGQISAVEMTFVPPNIWKGTDETQSALRQLSTEDGATEIQVIVKNPQKKLTPTSDRIKESVEYITRGGGEIRLKSGANTLYDSEEKVERRNITDDIEVETSTLNRLMQIVGRLFN